jgi:chaperonin GroES
MSLNLRPLGNQLVVEPLDEEEKSSFGIILPETAKEKPQKGTVLAVGPGRRLQKGGRQGMVVKEGEVVLYAKYVGSDIKIGDRRVLILNEDDILAIVS